MLELWLGEVRSGIRELILEPKLKRLRTALLSGYGVIETILKRYSNFVGFPIFLNGKRVNTLTAIWSSDPKEVTEEEYNAFYKQISRDYTDPLKTVHYRAEGTVEFSALISKMSLI